jgi:hypothetical protein
MCVLLNVPSELGTKVLIKRTLNFNFETTKDLDTKNSIVSSNWDCSNYVDIVGNFYTTIQHKLLIICWFTFVGHTIWYR